MTRSDNFSQAKSVSEKNKNNLLVTTVGFFSHNIYLRCNKIINFEIILRSQYSRKKSDSSGIA